MLQNCVKADTHLQDGYNIYYMNKVNVAPIMLYSFRR